MVGHMSCDVLIYIAECLRNGTMNDAKRLLKATGEEIEKATELFLKKGE